MSTTSTSIFSEKIKRKEFRLYNKSIYLLVPCWACLFEIIFDSLALARCLRVAFFILSHSILTRSNEQVSEFTCGDVNRPYPWLLMHAFLPLWTWFLEIRQIYKRWAFAAVEHFMWRQVEINKEKNPLKVQRSHESNRERRENRRRRGKKKFQTFSNSYQKWMINSLWQIHLTPQAFHH